MKRSWAFMMGALQHANGVPVEAAPPDDHGGPDREWMAGWHHADSVIKGEITDLGFKPETEESALREISLGLAARDNALLDALAFLEKMNPRILYLDFENILHRQRHINGLARARVLEWLEPYNESPQL